MLVEWLVKLVEAKYCCSWVEQRWAYESRYPLAAVQETVERDLVPIYQILRYLYLLQNTTTGDEQIIVTDLRRTYLVLEALGAM
jgi:hypothetical protein